MDLLSDPAIVRLCQSMEYNGTVSLHVQNQRLRIYPRRTADGTVMWSEMACRASEHFTLHDFPIGLYTKLASLEEETFSSVLPVDDTLYHVRIDVDSKRCWLVNRHSTSTVKCRGCRVTVNEPNTHCPDQISTPHITIKLDDRPDLKRLASRLGRFRKCTDTVMVSADRLGHLLFSLHSPAIRSFTITYSGQVKAGAEEEEEDDQHLLFGVSVKLGALLRCLRVCTGTSVEQVQFSVAHKEYLLVMSVVGGARVTAILPQFVE